MDRKKERKNFIASIEKKKRPFVITRYLGELSVPSKISSFNNFTVRSMSRFAISSSLSFLSSSRVTLLIMLPAEREREREREKRGESVRCS